MDAGTYRLIPAAITSPNSNSIVGGQVIRSDFATFHPDTAAWGTLASYLCAYDVHTIDHNAATLEADTLPQFTRAQTKPWAQWCQAWKVPDVSEALSADVAGPVPALLFRGDLTPFGSDDWLRRVRRGLSRDQTVTFPTLGSGLLASGPPCLSKSPARVPGRSDREARHRHLLEAVAAHPLRRTGVSATGRRVVQPVSFAASASSAAT